MKINESYSQAQPVPYVKAKILIGFTGWKQSP